MVARGLERGALQRDDATITRSCDLVTLEPSEVLSVLATTTETPLS